MTIKPLVCLSRRWTIVPVSPIKTVAPTGPCLPPAVPEAGLVPSQAQGEISSSSSCELSVGESIQVFDRPGVARAVLQTAL